MEDEIISAAQNLRQKAEEILATVPIKNASTLGDEDILRLIHELEVHQIELEMQNEELVEAREHAEVTMEKYTDLYDFAPSGYVTLSKEGDILDLNFSAGEMLGKNRSQFKNIRFGLYVSHDSLEDFNQLFSKTFLSNQKETSELSLLPRNDKPLYVHIDAIVSKNTNVCLITLIDVTERKKMEVELQKALHQYKELNRYFMDREMRMLDLKKEINELLLKSGCEEEYLI